MQAGVNKGLIIMLLMNGTICLINWNNIWKLVFLKRNFKIFKWFVKIMIDFMIVFKLFHYVIIYIFISLFL